MASISLDRDGSTTTYELEAHRSGVYRREAYDGEGWDAAPHHGRPTIEAALRDGAGRRAGRLLISRPPDQEGFDDEHQAVADLVASLLSDQLAHSWRDTEVRATAALAARADRMLLLVTEASSCIDALTTMLGELCVHHEATIGRIWRLSTDDLMQEVSRFNDDKLDATSYYRRPPSAPVSWGNSFTADAIRRNQPRTIIYSAIEQPERYVLLPAAIGSGLRSQVSFPIWVQDERFGIALAFREERPDLADVVADIAALANTIRPALFRKVTEDRIRFLAHHDDLTKLANRLVFQERMQQALQSASRGEHGLALLCLDLDCFKQVNDTRGHGVGDKLLAAVARRLQDNVREGDTVARMGGDEFAIVQPLGGQPKASASLAERLVERLGQPYHLDGERVVIGVSIGIAVYPHHGDTPDTMLRNADTALYRAKEAGRNRFRVFEPGMNVLRHERALMEGDMAEALALQQFRMAYQPLRDAATLAVIGFEALLRWNHPTRGAMEPDHFVSLAEASGLMVPLGKWALETACAEAVRWNPGIRLMVNLSPSQFRQPDLPLQVADILARTGLAPGRLDLEVTEGLLQNDADLVLNTMRALKSQGVSMTLDDFGTAYASLSYLRRFPFDCIKIDKSFVKTMCDDDETLAIVQTMIQLSTRLNLAVVAEGVESETQLSMLRGLGCNMVQGYLTGRPIPGEDVGAALVPPM